MIEELIKAYEVMAKDGKVAADGWSLENAPYGLDINDVGEVTHILPLGDHTKIHPEYRIMVPKRVIRSSGVKANFICDTASYLFADNDGLNSGDESEPKQKDKDRAMQCFESCAKLHHLIMQDSTDLDSRAVLAFFDRGPAAEHVKKLAGADYMTLLKHNIVLCRNERPLTQSKTIRLQWDSYYHNESDVGSEVLISSGVSGEKVLPVRLHPKIKGVWGAQSSGASLVSFNKDAFNSYGKKKGLNAPMSRYEAFAYTTALNTMLAEKNHTIHLGDTTIVFWSHSYEDQYNSFFSAIFRSQEATIDESTLLAVMNNLAKGRLVDINGFNLNPNEHFYILGLAPSAARISVRFFFKDSFGSFMERISQHYSDTAIEKRKIDRFERISVSSLLSQTVTKNRSSEKGIAKQKKKNQSISPRLVGDLFKAILYGVAYPSALLNFVELRIQAEHDINREKAAIIKAYYIRKPNLGCPKEVLKMSINEETRNIPYVLGRLFSVYEQIQNAANPEINTTIKDRYFASAAAQPSYVFPVLGDLAQKHLSKLSKKQKIYYGQQLDSLMPRLGEQFPRRLTLPEHGSFQLGYYFQNQKRYTPKFSENGISKASSDVVE